VSPTCQSAAINFPFVGYRKSTFPSHPMDNVRSLASQEENSRPPSAQNTPDASKQSLTSKAIYFLSRASLFTTTILCPFSTRKLQQDYQRELRTTVPYLELLCTRLRRAAARKSNRQAMRDSFLSRFWTTESPWHFGVLCCVVDVDVGGKGASALISPVQHLQQGGGLDSSFVLGDSTNCHCYHFVQCILTLSPTYAPIASPHLVLILDESGPDSLLQTIVY